MGKPALTAKQQAFVSEYLVDLNATQAAIRAGYKEKNAYQVGSENLRKPQIQSAIQEAREAREKATLYDSAWIIAQIAEIAQDPEQAARDRLKALELLGKHHGLWEKREDPEAQGIKVVFETEMEAWSE